MFYVYILYSEKCSRYYVGYSEDVERRLIRHNEGRVSATKNCRPYSICKYKTFDTQTEARKEEIRIKKKVEFTSNHSLPAIGSTPRFKSGWPATVVTVQLRSGALFLKRFN